MTGVTEYTVADIYDYISKVRIILVHPQVAWSVSFVAAIISPQKRNLQIPPKMHAFFFPSMKREHLF
jgi:hypothetical protein